MSKKNESPSFIDLFSGCGGLSLGLSQGGWKGIFAIEKAADAFDTFSANLLDKSGRYCFAWPDQWLDRKAHSIDDVLGSHIANLIALNRKIDLIAGGPPCQGFSFAGKRNGSDPRNRMLERYVTFVKIIEPKFLVLENVPGMKVAHTDPKRMGASRKGSKASFYETLTKALGAAGYDVAGDVLNARDFAVPQSRPRLVVVGVRNDIAASVGGAKAALDLIRESGRAQRVELGLRSIVTARDAISDLEVEGRETEACTDPLSRKNAFRVLAYTRPRSAYQRLMHGDVQPEQMDSLRLANHTSPVIKRFTAILKKTYAKDRRGLNLSAEHRKGLGMLKHRTVPMHPDLPAPTLTTLPDDVIHYAEPRILTVRESARIQSFPDWFVFRGKFTTGGELRRTDCPRYTQVGNAVPPLMGRAIGIGLLAALNSAQATEERAELRERELVT